MTRTFFIPKRLLTIFDLELFAGLVWTWLQILQERRFEYILAFADHAEPLRGHPTVNFWQASFVEIDPALEKMRNWTLLNCGDGKECGKPRSLIRFRKREWIDWASSLFRVFFSYLVIQFTNSLDKQQLHFSLFLASLLLGSKLLRTLELPLWDKVTWKRLPGNFQKSKEMRKTSWIWERFAPRL